MQKDEEWLQNELCEQIKEPASAVFVEQRYLFTAFVFVSTGREEKHKLVRRDKEQL